jgi:hypothetical protein
LIARTSRLWAVTSYFNPAGYRQRRTNYDVFRKRLGVPLLTVELVYGAAPELGPDDAEIIVRLRGGDVMWQKERLINIGVARLPTECDKVVWFDCDVFFTDPGWAVRLEGLLDDVVLAQPFAHVRYLTQRWSAADAEPEVDFSRQSVAAAIVGGMSLEDCLLPPIHDRRIITAPGFAWGARRELLARHPIYDAAIIGGGDRFFASAACGFLEGARRVHIDAPRLREHFCRWAVPFAGYVGGRIGFLDLDLFNLWHGDLVNRRDSRRNHELVDFGFDPFSDIALDEQGVWRWNSDKPALHAHLRDYFLGRREDG